MTPDALEPTEAWMFATYCGGQCHEPKDGRVERAWPVFDGDIPVALESFSVDK